MSMEREKRKKSKKRKITESLCDAMTDWITQVLAEASEHVKDPRRECVREPRSVSLISPVHVLGIQVER